MRHDAKIGLALGMLVIGFAVAFCFPRHPAVDAWPRLDAVPAISDKRMDFIPIRAYQPKVADSSVVAARASEETELASANTESIEPIALPLPVPATNSASVPVPSPHKSVAAGPEPPRERPANEQAMLEKESSAEIATAPGLQIYRVQLGDTLSGIAGRLLGNQGRFQEIYEANRNVLSSPNSLQVGMELTIPVPPSSGRGIANSSSPGERASSPTVPPPFEQANGDHSIRR